MKSLKNFLIEALTINEGGLESDKFLLIAAKQNSKADKELQDDWADAILTNTNSDVYVYALPRDIAESMKDTYKDDVTLWIIPVKEYPYLNNFEDAYTDGVVTLYDLAEYRS